VQPADEMAGHFEQAPIVLELPHSASPAAPNRPNRSNPKPD
jgi:hypothetical protein